jgi:hypothetical protein
MKLDGSLDRESFEMFLSNAFLVQQSGIDALSLSAFVKIQRSIASGECGVDEAMRQVADHAREVANATGVAIALMEADQLVYRVGSGSAAERVGRHVTAVLSTSAGNVRKEILRVENANADSRIEAEICRQFGGTSLLMLPIYRGHVVAGVLEVIFSTEHAFQDREVRAYRLLAGLIEEAMGGAPARAGVEEQLPPAIPEAVEQIAAQVQKFYATENAAPATAEPEPWVREACAAAAGTSPGPAAAAKQKTEAIENDRGAALAEQWRKATAATAVGALVIAVWFAYTHRMAATSGGPMTVSSTPVGQQIVPVPSKPLPSDVSYPRTPHQSARDESLPGFTRKRVGPNEVDYVADDVTMRVFTPKYQDGPAQRWSRQVRFGNDVTVRYFADGPSARLRSSSESTGDQPDHSSSVSK